MNIFERFKNRILFELHCLKSDYKMHRLNKKIEKLSDVLENEMMLDEKNKIRSQIMDLSFIYEEILRRKNERKKIYQKQLLNFFVY